MTRQKPIYSTPREFLIRYLSNPDDYQVYAQWTDEMKTFTIDAIEFLEQWARVRMKKYNGYLAGHILMEVEFIRSLLASTEHIRERRGGVIECRLITRSDQKRISVNDLKKAPLYQWILQFLLEQTRVDFIQYTNKNELEFEILDMKGMGEMYTKVNGIKTGNGVYNMKLLLSSYCMTGILIKVGKNKYKFERKWLENELERTEPEESVDDLKRHFCESMARFPEHTLPTCDFENWLSYGELDENLVLF